MMWRIRLRALDLPSRRTNLYVSSTCLAQSYVDDALFELQLDGYTIVTVNDTTRLVGIEGVNENSGFACRVFVALASEKCDEIGNESYERYILIDDIVVDESRYTRYRRMHVNLKNASFAIYNALLGISLRYRVRASEERRGERHIGCSDGDDDYYDDDNGDDDSRSGDQSIDDES